MSEIKKQSDFHQTRANEAKLGAYYTDPEHCERIHNLLEFPEGEVCCLDPSVGDASSVLRVVGKRESGSPIKVYGVELNKETAYGVLQNPLVDECLHADFLTGVVISHRSFSFCFANPPYGTTRENRRLETEFLGKVVPYLTKDAVLAFVIPRYVAKDLSFLKAWCKNFQTLMKFRFTGGEYEKWKQVVLIGRRREGGCDKGELERLQRELECEEGILTLPKTYEGDKIVIEPSRECCIRQFSTREFDAERALGALSYSPLKTMIREKSRVEPYTVDHLNRPPILPCNGQLYLLAVTGGGQGLVGSEENQDLHLQRGVAKVVTKSEFVKEADGKKGKEVVTSYTQVSFHIIENDGTVRMLQ